MQTKTIMITTVFEDKPYCFGLTEDGTDVLLHKNTFREVSEFNSLRAGDRLEVLLYHTKKGVAAIPAGSAGVSK